MNDHNPTRPGWRCQWCNDHWPCSTYQKWTLARYRGPAAVPLAMYLAACMVEAAADMPHAPAGDLCVRFLGWLTQRW